MFESGEAWLVTCGEVNRTVTVRSRTCFKNDRCFVTANNEFHACLMQMSRVANMREPIVKLLKSCGLGNRVKHMRRLLDIRMDANIRQGGCGHCFNFV
uniref:Uncharacterized protein n=1 Tax=Physcomitrium patens TaxID=3218 RepID=A0A2K1IP27_PHYPA|nr:hypothetical protein PHYPA_027349 [Physcomitrium patens]